MLKNKKNLFRNIIVSPMCQYSSINGCPSQWHYKHLSNLITSGAAKIILEATAVNKEGRITNKDLCLFRNEHEKQLKKLIKFLKSIKNVPIYIQLSHAGRKGSSHIPWEKFNTSLKKGAWATISASQLKKDKGWPVPKSATNNQIKKIKKDFLKSAVRAKRIGFDGIEVHMAHGYLLHQFLSPISNIRKDIYGGNLENRCRLPLEIASLIKKKIKSDLLLGARITGTDHVKGGIQINDAIYLSKKLEKIGFDYLCVSSGGILTKTKLNQNRKAFRANIAKKIKNKTKKIIIGTTGNLENLRLLNYYFKKNFFDLAFIGRPFLRNPNWLYQYCHKKIIPLQYRRIFK